MAAKKNRIKVIVLFGGVDKKNVTSCNASQCNPIVEAGCKQMCQLENKSRPQLQPISDYLDLVIQIAKRTIVLGLLLVFIFDLIANPISSRNLPHSSVELIKTVLDIFKN